MLRPSAFIDIDSTKGDGGEDENAGGWGFGWRQASLLALKAGLEVGVIQHDHAVRFKLGEKEYNKR